ncbi:MAG TPA: hypothetical protein VGC44_12750 [Longimicrobiales bacterium]
MSHVDDGELTAYADGAYPVSDPDALRISAHLSTCDNCRTRLEQAHALRDRTAEILAYATPSPVVAPPFETLQAQIATSPVKARRHINLAWAATIIMALGLGWFGRGAWQNPPSERNGMTTLNVPTASTEVAEEDVSPPPAAAPAPQPESRVAQDAALRRREMDAVQDLRAKREPTAGAGAAAAGVGAVTGNARVANAPPPAPLAAAAEGRPVAVESHALRESNFISAAEAERRGVVFPRIPELPVAQVAPGDTTLIDQTLADGKVVRLTVTNVAVADADRREQRSAAARAAAPSAPQMQKTRVAEPAVTVSRSGKLITITGDLPADSLRALAQKIK